MNMSIIQRLGRYANKKYACFRMRILFYRQFYLFKMNKSARFKIRYRDRWPCYNDATSYSGFDKHYIYHTGWASRVLSVNRPKKHIDISSSLYFCVNASAFVPMEYYDYRPAKIMLDGLVCKYCDLMCLPFEDNQIESISCMHVIEHIGLGRYGEPLDYNGDIKAAQELMRVTASGGALLIVVPIGSETRIQFNAHRIYKYDDFVKMFPGMVVKEFSLIPDDDNEEGLIRNADVTLADKQNYGCGCFLFRKTIHE